LQAGCLRKAGEGNDEDVGRDFPIAISRLTAFSRGIRSQSSCSRVLTLSWTTSIFPQPQRQPFSKSLCKTLQDCTVMMLTSAFFTLLVALTLVLSATAQPGNHHARNSVSRSGYVKLPLHHNRARTSLSRRRSIAPLRNDSSGDGYLIDSKLWLPPQMVMAEIYIIVTIGSDKQTAPVLFDTGSTQTWVNPDCSKLNANRGQTKEACLAYSRCNPYTSTSAHIQNKALNAWFTDDILLGNLTAKDTHVGVAAVSEWCDVGIFGAGFSHPPAPPTIIQILADQGQINSYAFSLTLPTRNKTGMTPTVPYYLRAPTLTSSGAVILGGIDTKK
jgi:hypothetical protein